MKRPSVVELELETDRYINGGSPSNTEKYLLELETRIQKMEKDLANAKRSGFWTNFGNVVNS